MGDVRLAVLASSAAQYFIRFLGFISIVVFSRLLTPAELGVFGIASSVVMIVTELRVLGAALYLIRVEKLTEGDVRSGLGLTLIMSWGLGACLFFGAGYVAAFYAEPGLSMIFKILSLGFVVAPFIIVITALLNRDLKFKETMIAQSLGVIIQFLVSLLLVLRDYSFIGLAWGVFVGIVAEFLVLLLFFTPREMSWLPRFSGLGKIVKLGVYSSLTTFLGRFDANASDLIIGKLGTTTHVAIYSRGLGFLLFLSQIIQMGIRSVVFPYLSQVKREGGDLKVAYVRASELLGSLLLPVMAVAGVASYPVIILIFGENWVESAPVVTILSIWAMFRYIHTLSPALLISSNNENIMLYKQVVVFTVTVLGIYFAYPYGLEAVAWAMVIAGMVDFSISSWSVYRSTGLTPWGFVVAVRKNFILCFICWGGAMLLDYLVDFEKASPITSFLYLLFVMPVIWLATVWLLKHSIFSELMLLAGKLVQRLKKSPEND